MTQGFFGPSLDFHRLYAGHEDTFMCENDSQVGCKTDLFIVLLSVGVRNPGLDCADLTPGSNPFDQGLIPRWNMDWHCHYE